MLVRIVVKRLIKVGSVLEHIQTLGSVLHVIFLIRFASLPVFLFPSCR